MSDTNFHETLGVDIGGVIIDRSNDNTDTSFFSDNYLSIPPVTGAFEALRRLSNERFGARIYLVSKCGPRIQAKTLAWLKHRNFYNKTGIAPENVLFCRERHEKAIICRKTHITHFIDDRLEVLGYLRTVKNLYVFRPNPDEVKHFAKFLDRVHIVNTWEEVLVKFLPNSPRLT